MTKKSRRNSTQKMTKSTEDIITIQFDGEKMEKKSTYEKNHEKNHGNIYEKFLEKYEKIYEDLHEKIKEKFTKLFFFRLFCDPDFQLEQLTTNSFDHSGTGFAYPACSALSCLT